jgi:hypothetical protein
VERNKAPNVAENRAMRMCYRISEGDGILELHSSLQSKQQILEGQA